MKKNRFFTNTFASIVYEVVAFAMGILLPRLFLSHYGSNVNGLVTSIAQFLSVISLCELGIGAVVRANLYEPLLKNDVYRINCILKSSRLFFRKVALILAGYIIVLISVYPLIAKDNPFDYWYSGILILIISLSFFSQYFFGINYQLLLNADQRAYVYLLFNAATIVLNIAASYLLVYFGFSIIVVKTATAVLFSIRPLFLYLFVKKHYQIDYKVSYNQEPISQKWNGFAQHLGTVVQDNTDTIVLTIFSSLINVSIYGVYNLVITGVKSLIGTSYVGLTPILGKKIAEADQKELESFFEYSEWATHSFSSYIFAITLILIIPFVSLYTAGVEDANYVIVSFAYLITACGFIRCVQMIYNTVVQSAGHFKQTQVAAFIEPIINIALSIAFVWWFGIVGVTIGTLVSLSFRLIYLIIYLNKNIVFLKIKKTILQFLCDFIFITIMFVISLFIGNNISTWLEWVLFGFLFAIIGLGVFLLINFIFNFKKIKISLSYLFTFFRK